MTTRLGRYFEPGDQVVNHFAKQQAADWLTTSLVWCLEPRLIVTVDG